MKNVTIIFASLSFAFMLACGGGSETQAEDSDSTASDDSPETNAEVNHEESCAEILDVGKSTIVLVELSEVYADLGEPFGDDTFVKDALTDIIDWAKGVNPDSPEG